MTTAIVWVRRDLRLDDHRAIEHAAGSAQRLVAAFVLDPVLLRGERVGAPIVQQFFDALADVRDALQKEGSDLALLEGDAATELAALAKRTGATELWFGADPDPAAVRRDAAVVRALAADGIVARSVVNDTLRGSNEIVREDGAPYVVFGAFRRRWEALIAADPRPAVPSAALAAAKWIARSELGATRPVPRPEAYGHASSAAYPRGGLREAARRLSAFAAGPIEAYAARRNEPASDATSHLSPHLRSGAIGIRRCVDAARAAEGSGPATWLVELIWREFYHQILAHHPRVAQEPFARAARAIHWRDDEVAFDAWQRGATGYPIVDAAMRQLNTIGWMHNRLRMIVASFLTKHLLIDYRHGERIFEQRLADADLAANNGGWQWTAGTGTDAAPYFRVFNPVKQGTTFDPAGTFVRRWIPELARLPDRYVHAPWTAPPLVAAEAGAGAYPAPIVDHAEARARALAAFGAALGKSSP